MGKLSQFSVFLLIQVTTWLVWAAIVVFSGFSPWLAWLVVLGPLLFVAWRWHDGYWWLLIHAFFLPFSLFALRLEIPPLWYLAAFGLCWLVFGRVWHSRVPLYFSNRQAMLSLAQMLPQGAHLLDIGGGAGTVLAWLGRHRPDLKLSGVELAWLPWLIGRIRLPRSVEWRRMDYQQLDFGVYDAAYAFLSSEPMSDLWQKACIEMRPGTLFVSNTFAVPDEMPDEIIELGDWKGGKLLLWHM